MDRNAIQSSKTNPVYYENVSLLSGKPSNRSINHSLNSPSDDSCTKTVDEKDINDKKYAVGSDKSRETAFFHTEGMTSNNPYTNSFTVSPLLQSTKLIPSPHQMHHQSPLLGSPLQPGAFAALPSLTTSPASSPFLNHLNMKQTPSSQFQLVQPLSTRAVSVIGQSQTQPQSSAPVNVGMLLGGITPVKNKQEFVKGGGDNNCDNSSLFSIPVQSKLMNNNDHDVEILEKTIDYLGIDDDQNESETMSILLSGQVTTGEDLLGRSLWVGNVDPTVPEGEIRGIFGRFGEIESMRLLPEKQCVFINYKNAGEAYEARQAMEGGRLGNCILKVAQQTETVPTQPQLQVSPSTLSNSGLINQQSRSLWVGNLSPNVKPSEFVALFERFGSIESSRVIPNASRAKDEINGRFIDGMQLRVGFAKNVASTEESDEALFTIENPEYPFVMEIQKLKHLNQESQESKHSIDPGHLRDLKRKLEHGHLSQRELDHIFGELFPEIIELATDGFGNTVVQKLIERASDLQRMKIIEKCQPQLESIGIHKNGTWVVQKMIEFAKTTQQINTLVQTLKPFIPALLMDPFGNYVVQGCLCLGPSKDQFVFDAMFIKCLEVGQGKFGARAMRACLESQLASKKQQKQIAVAVIRHAMILITNQNGILLIHWLVDNCDLNGRFSVLVQKLIHRIPFLCNQKLSNVVILKLLSQTAEPEARRQVIMDGIFKDEESLHQTLSGQTNQQMCGEINALAEYGLLAITRSIQTEKNDQQRLQMIRMLKQVADKYLSHSTKLILQKKIEESFGTPILSLYSSL